MLYYKSNSYPITRLILTFLLLISLQSSAQIDPALIDQFQTAFQDYGEATQVKGMSIAIRTADDVWTDQYGVSGESDPLTENHLFAMGSVTKTIMSATILRMYEDNLLSLDDPLSEYLDTYVNVDPNVTIRELMNHTSGIYNYTNNPDWLNDVYNDPEYVFELEEILANWVLGPVFPHGTDYSYSNTNYILLGLIISEISGQSYYEEARERFDFDANYPSLAILPFEISPESLAHLWANWPGYGVIDVQEEGISLNSLFSSAASAGAYAATPNDLSQWIRDLYTGELLQPSTMVELFTPSAFNPLYGLGVRLENINCSTNTDIVGHSGGIKYKTAAFYNEEYDLVVTVQTNDGDTNTDMFALSNDMFCINIDFNLSINDEINRESFAVYPNPVQDALIIDSTNNTQITSIKFYDLLGRLVITESGNISEIDVSHLKSGVLFLEIETELGVIAKKIIKE